MAANPRRLLKPEVLARLGTLDLIARTVVDGVMTGLHRSPNFGFSQEFAEYRAYNEGDDLRFVDWNVFARTDRAYIKRFRGETNTTVFVLLDASASMAFGEPTTKLQQACYLAASICYIASRQHDAIGLTVFDEGVRTRHAPSSKPDALMQNLALLERTEAGQGTDLIAALDSLHAGSQRRGLVILVSDLYADPDEVLSALQAQTHSGHDIAVFHVHDQEEATPAAGKIRALKSLESGNTVVVDPDFLVGDYTKRFIEHSESLESACRRTGADYVKLMTHEPLDAALHAYLQFRARRGR